MDNSVNAVSKPKYTQMVDKPGVWKRTADGHWVNQNETGAMAKVTGVLTSTRDALSSAAGMAYEKVSEVGHVVVDKASHIGSHDASENVDRPGVWKKNADGHWVNQNDATITKKVTGALSSAATKVYSTLSTVSHVVADKASTVSHVVADKASTVSHVVADKASTVSHVVADKASTVSHVVADKASTVSHVVADKASTVSHVVADKASTVSHVVADKASSASHVVTSKVSGSGEHDTITTASSTTTTKTESGPTWTESISAKASDATNMISSKAADAKTMVSSKAADAKTMVSSKAADAKTMVSSKAADAKTIVSSKAADAKTMVSSKAVDVSHAVMETAQNTKTKLQTAFTTPVTQSSEVEQTSASAHDTGASWKESMSAKASDVSNAVKETAQSAKSKVQSTISGTSANDKEVSGESSFGAFGSGASLKDNLAATAADTSNTIKESSQTGSTASPQTTSNRSPALRSIGSGADSQKPDLTPYASLSQPLMGSPTEEVPALSQPSPLNQTPDWSVGNLKATSFSQSVPVPATSFGIQTQDMPAYSYSTVNQPTSAFIQTQDTSAYSQLPGFEAVNTNVDSYSALQPASVDMPLFSQTSSFSQTPDLSYGSQQSNLSSFSQTSAFDNLQPGLTSYSSISEPTPFGSQTQHISYPQSSFSQQTNLSQPSTFDYLKADVPSYTPSAGMPSQAGYFDIPQNSSWVQDNAPTSDKFSSVFSQGQDQSLGAKSRLDRM